MGASKFTRTLDVRSEDWFDNSYHAEIIGATSGYTTGYTIVLTGECKSHRIICQGGNDIVYAYLGSNTMASTGVSQTNTRHKLIATTTGTETVINQAATVLDFDIRGGGTTINIFVDSYY